MGQQPPVAGPKLVLTGGRSQLQQAQQQAQGVLAQGAFN
jgi:hypothetical protein